MESKKKDKEVKRAYIKPKLLIIELALDEVLGIGCKSVSVGGLPVAPCQLSGCALDGS